MSFFSALLGGVLTFLAPCTLPLIPAYIAFINGSIEGHHTRRQLMVNALFFVLGFSVIFIAYGVISGSLGVFMVLHRKLLAQIGGVLIILFGLSMLGLLRIPLSFLPTSMRLPSWAARGSKLGAFTLGFLFAFGWSPCLGPVLGTILVLASGSAEPLYGAMLLLVYSLGLAIPFLLVAYLYGTTFHYVTRLERYIPIITRCGAIVLVLIGVLLLMGQFGLLNTWMLELFGDIGYDKFVNYM